MNADAEALVELMEPHEKRWIEPALTRALAAERRATVERLRKRIPDGPSISAIPNWRPIEWLHRILDDEAQR